MSRLMMPRFIGGAGKAPALAEAKGKLGRSIGRRPFRGSEGYTLLQIVVTLAVVSVLVTVALPSTVIALRNYRLMAAVSAATGAITANRYQAIMHAYPYNITFNTNGAYQVANEVPPATTFTNVGTSVPLSGNGDVTINQTTTLQFNANGTVSATAGSLSFTITNLNNKVSTITVTGVGDVTSN